MFDTLTELGVKTAEASPVPPASRAARPKTAKPRRVTIENGTAKTIEFKPSIVEFEPESPTIVDDDGSQMSSMSSSKSSKTGSSSSKSSSEEDDTSKSGSSSEDDSEASGSAESTPRSNSRRGSIFIY